MDFSVEDVEFLSRSSSRVEVLEAIAGSPRARHELREFTGASRVTVNWNLDDLEDLAELAAVEDDPGPAEFAPILER